MSCLLLPGLYRIAGECETAIRRIRRAWPPENPRRPLRRAHALDAGKSRITSPGHFAAGNANHVKVIPGIHGAGATLSRNQQGVRTEARLSKERT